MAVTYVTICLLGAVFIGAGLLLFMAPPKKVNNVYGYRTKRSMQSQKHWDHAQSLSGKIMTSYAIAATVCSLAITYFFNERFSELTLILLTTAFHIAGIGLMIYRVESSLKGIDEG